MTVIVTAVTLRTLSPAEAAALWKVQQDSDSPVEAGLFEAWLGADDANVEAWAALQDHWSVFDDHEDPDFATIRAGALSAGRAGDRPRYWLGAAAAALVAAIGGGTVLLKTRPPEPSEHASETVYAATDAVRTIVLSDGSRMTLDVGSRARGRFAGGTRHVFLDQGRALFVVHHDDRHPFTVEARGRTIVDVGTRFEVGVSAAALRVSLYEGQVRIDGGGAGATTLVPGQSIEVRAGRTDAITTLAAGSEALWREGLTQFDNATLAVAAERVNVGSPVTLVIVDPNVAKMHISGRFRLRDAERFARTVAEILPVRVIRLGGGRIELRAGR